MVGNAGRVLGLSGLMLLSSCFGAGGNGDGDTARDGGSPSPGCLYPADCALGQVCDRARAVCADCRTLLDCGADEDCDDGRCVVAPSCGGDLDCQATQQLCSSPAGGVCVECRADTGCAAGSCVFGSCRPQTDCQNSLDCTGQTMVCEAEGGVCVECLSAGDCGVAAECVFGFCFEACRSSGRICGSTATGVECGACSLGVCIESGRACRTWDVSLVNAHARRSDPSPLLADPTHVYLTDDRKLQRIARTDGEVTTIHSPASPDDFFRFSINATHVFVVTTLPPVTLMRAPKAGGSFEVIASTAGSCDEIAAAEDRVFCANPARGLDEISLSTGVWRTVRSGQAPLKLQVHGTTLFFVDNDDFSFASLDFSTGVYRQRIADLLVVSVLYNDGYVIDGDQLYYQSDGGNQPQISVVPLSGGVPTLFVDGGLLLGAESGRIFFARVMEQMFDPDVSVWEAKTATGATTQLLQTNDLLQSTVWIDVPTFATAASGSFQVISPSGAMGFDFSF